MILLTIVAIWLGIGVLTMLIISITSDAPEETAGMLGLIALMGPLSTMIILCSGIRRYMNRRRELNRLYE